jgi:hypothetical protein
MMSGVVGGGGYLSKGARGGGYWLEIPEVDSVLGTGRAQRDARG